MAIHVVSFKIYHGAESVGVGRLGELLVASSSTSYDFAHSVNLRQDVNRSEVDVFVVYLLYLESA